MTADDNLRLIREIEANRAFLLAAYQQNPKLLARAEPRIRDLFEPPPFTNIGGRHETGTGHWERRTASMAKASATSGSTGPKSGGGVGY